MKIDIFVLARIFDDAISTRHYRMIRLDSFGGKKEHGVYLDTQPMPLGDPFMSHLVPSSDLFERIGRVYIEVQDDPNGVVLSPQYLVTGAIGTWYPFSMKRFGVCYPGLERVSSRVWLERFRGDYYTRIKAAVRRLQADAEKAMQVHNASIDAKEKREKETTMLRRRLQADGVI